jgi:hypothetical protein
MQNGLTVTARGARTGVVPALASLYARVPATLTALTAGGTCWLSPVSGCRGTHRVQGEPTGRGAGDDLALGIGGAGRLAEPDGGLVLLLRQRQVPKQPGSFPDPGDQHPGGHGVERATVADPPGAGEPPEPGDHIVRGQPGGLVADDQPVRGGHFTASLAGASLAAGGWSSPPGHPNGAWGCVVPEARWPAACTAGG